MADEYYFKSFQDYLKDLCIANVDVLHNDLTKMAFVKFQSEQGLQAIPNNAGSVMVAVADYTGRAIGSFEEHKLQQVTSILFLVNVSATGGNVYNAIEAAQDKAMRIMLDFYARMKNDLLTDDCGPLRYLQPEQMTFFAADGPVLENFYGWEMNIPFNVNAPIYNPAKWIP